MSRVRPLLRKVFPVAALVAVCMLAATIAATLAILGSGSGVLDASVSSRVPVDYSADRVALTIPRLSPEIIDAIRRDRAAGSDSASPGGSGSQAPPGTVPTPRPSGGATPPPNTRGAATPTPPLPVPTPLPTLPVATPTPLPVPTLPPPPTLPPTPTLPALR